MVKKPPPPVEPQPPPKKKKGRPSLADLKKRALIAQQQQDDERKATNSTAPVRRSTRRNPIPNPSDDDDDSPVGKRREKKLKLVLENGDRRSENPSDGDCSDRDAGELSNSTPMRKVMGGAQEEHSDSGPMTPLPDKKMLITVLERLQKKDKYGVYSEPVDPEELPDYHEIIKHPMDFSTVRKKLDEGAYANLEQFEKDILLISSNAMEYNSPNTIYFRQARSIEELAKKSFENIRQGTEENEPEVKVVRRGRPPGKNFAKKPMGRPPAEQQILDSSPDVIVNNTNTTNSTSLLGSSNDLTRRGSVPNILGFMTASQSSQILYSMQNHFQFPDLKHGKNEENSGFMQKGLSSRYGKKPPVSEDNYRSAYPQPLPPAGGVERPILSTFLGEKKHLVPIGVFMEHAYARSLARFAANFGPIGWEIAAKRIERVLPSGTNFGRGWVGENDLPQIDRCQTNASSSPLPHPASVTSANHAVSDMDEVSNILPHQPEASLVPSDVTRGNINGLHDDSIVQQKGATLTHQNTGVSLQPKINGLNRIHLDLSQLSNMPMQVSLAGDLHPDVPITHAQLLDMVSRTHNVKPHPAVATSIEAERTGFANLSCSSNARYPIYSASDAQMPITGTEGITNFGNDVNHLPMKISELEKMNVSNATLLKSGSTVSEPSSTGSCNDWRFRYPGTINHRFGLHHSAVDPYVAEKSTSGDPQITNAYTSNDGPASKAIEIKDRLITNTVENMPVTNHHSEGDGNVPYSDSSLSNSARHSLEGQPVHNLNTDSLCPDLNSVSQTAG